jgi:hypothetical protein
VPGHISDTVNTFKDPKATPSQKAEQVGKLIGDGMKIVGGGMSMVPGPVGTAGKIVTKASDFAAPVIKNVVKEFTNPDPIASKIPGTNPLTTGIVKGLKEGGETVLKKVGEDVEELKKTAVKVGETIKSDTYADSGVSLVA